MGHMVRSGKQVFPAHLKLQHDHAQTLSEWSMKSIKILKNNHNCTFARVQKASLTPAIHRGQRFLGGFDKPEQL